MVNRCTIAQIIGESQRFLFHVFLIHITTNIIDGKNIITIDLFNTLIITALAIILYHIFIRKIVEPYIKKMKSICYIDKKKKLIKNINKKNGCNN